MFIGVPSLIGIVLVTLTWIVWEYVIPTYAKGVVTHVFNVKLEDHKGELQAALEERKGALRAQLEDHKHELSRLTQAEAHNYQRLIQDFTLYRTKKHEVYPQLYKALLIADGSIRRLTGLRREPTFVGYDSSDIQNYLEGQGIAHGKTEYFKSRWESAETQYQREQIADEISNYLRMIETHEARTEWYKARNFVLEYEIYLSDEVAEQADAVLDILNKYLIHVEIPIPGQQREVSETDIVAAETRLKQTIKHELSVADYEGRNA